MSDSPMPQPASNRRLRWALYTPFALLMLFVLAWSGLWFYAAGKVDAAVNAWLEDQQKQGMMWTCPNRSLTGFPFRFEFSCRAPTFRSTAVPSGTQGQLSGLHAVAHIYQPDRVIAQLDSPLSLQLPNNAGPVRISWDNFRVSLAGLAGTDAQADVAVSAPALATSAGGVDTPRANAGRMELHVRRSPGRPAPDKAGDVAISVADLTVGTVDALTQTSLPATLALQGTITQIHQGNDETLPDWLEIWRQAGGVFELSTLQVTKGDVKLYGSGQLALDETHRAQGEIALNAAGLEPVLNRLGIPSAALGVGGLLSGLLGGKPKPAQGTGTPLAFTLHNGKVTMGPVKLPVTLVPLY